MENYQSSTLLCKFFQILFTNGVCLRCIFRVFRQENINLYRDKSLYSEILMKVGERLGDPLLLLNQYDFLNYCCKNQGQTLQQKQTFQQQEFRLPSTMKDQIIQKETTTFQPEPTDCIVCLGILQRIDSESFMQKVLEKVNADDYEFENFKITVRCSLGISVRQLSAIYLGQKEARQWCEENKVEVTKDDETALGYSQVLNVPIDIKASVKWLMSGQLSEMLNQRSDANDDRFQISLVFENLQDDFHQFSIFQDTVRQMQEVDWEDKIQKKVSKMIINQLKANNQHYKEQIQTKHENKKSKQVEAFIPSSTNLDKIAKIKQSFFTDTLLNNTFPARSPFAVKVEVKSAHQNIYIKGNYIKYARFISQTPWFINEQRIYETSIQDIIAAPCMAIFKPTDVKFHSGGREDIDVRMLGDGRPFVIELVDPHKGESNLSYETLLMIQEEINKGTQVNIRNIQFTDPSCFMDLKNSETNKIKAYCCIVQVSGNITNEQYDQINSVQSLEINQKTPIRVLHRRTLLDRKKMIYKLKAIKLNSQFMILYVLASAGTYIKEFIHGDLDRTKPNLCDLLNAECDIFQLDVVKLYVEANEEALKDFNNLDSVES